MSVLVCIIKLYNIWFARKFIFNNADYSKYSYIYIYTIIKTYNWSLNQYYLAKIFHKNL